MEEVLRMAGLKPRDLTAIAVALGPGSFTGLRIGLSYAKGLAMALGLRLVGVPTLDAMALCAVGSPLVRSGVTICPVLDARKGEVYVALYRAGDDALEKVVGEQVAPLEDFALRISGEVVFVGESKAEDARMLLSLKGRGASTVEGGEFRASMGGFIAALGAAKAARNDVDDIVALEPLYLRPPDASIRAPEVSLSASAKPGEDSYGTSRGRANPAACRP
jgi:tRNA threonylcarbamoyladenosine biosynthesis protein TsaB